MKSPTVRTGFLSLILFSIVLFLSACGTTPEQEAMASANPAVLGSTIVFSKAGVESFELKINSIEPEVAGQHGVRFYVNLSTEEDVSVIEQGVWKVVKTKNGEIGFSLSVAAGGRAFINIPGQRDVTFKYKEN